jgi:hypothetical protein
MRLRKNTVRIAKRQNHAAPENRITEDDLKGTSLSTVKKMSCRGFTNSETNQ